MVLDLLPGAGPTRRDHGGKSVKYRFGWGRRSVGDSHTGPGVLETGGEVSEVGVLGRSVV